ncbi:sec-independent protein translocase protein TatA [Streptomyces sp. BK208]|uniref:twin-arginine translocase TatA/TatE family subunit n=1 Tax=Streptomyces sp. BK208 TaxID=2512150 RepID=UPI00105FC5D1|nr:twin-arginine translocase TatA/TatE family subunit [Streptomyces sp. BK208]TDT35306.1 sec-independent protein translocase protein TatA [Streptomyces sp. BK208]
MFGLSEIALVLVVVAVVLAVKKLPELTRSAGRSARILKSEARATRDADEPGTPRVIQGEAVRREDGPGTGAQDTPRA